MIALNFKEISDMIQNIFLYPKMFCSGDDNALKHSFDSLIYGMNVCRGTSSFLLKLQAIEVKKRKGGCVALVGIVQSFEEILEIHKNIEEKLLKEIKNND